MSVYIASAYRIFMSREASKRSARVRILTIRFARIVSLREPARSSRLAYENVPNKVILFSVTHIVRSLVPQTDGSRHS